MNCKIIVTFFDLHTLKEADSKPTQTDSKTKTHAMKNRTQYEWGYDNLDPYGDIIETDFADKLVEYNKPGRGGDELCLIRNLGNDADGLVERQWAYVEDGKLPDWFDGGAGIPNRFRKELEQFLSK